MRKWIPITLIILLLCTLAYAAKWSDYPDQSSIADADTLLFLDQDDVTAAKLNEITWAQIKTQLGTDGIAAPNEAYGSGWNADTVVPRKDNIYDYLHNFDADDDGSFTDETWYTALLPLAGGTMTGDATFANGKGIKSSTTTAQTLVISGYDVDLGAYVPMATFTNSNTPSLSFSAVGLAQLQSTASEVYLGPAGGGAVRVRDTLQVDSPDYSDYLQVYVTNGAGATFDVTTNGTADFTFADPINIGNADTTLARSDAGVVSIEGVVIPTISSSNTFTNKTYDAGGTGNSLTLLDSASPTIDSAGDFAIDTTNDQLKYYGTAAAVVDPLRIASMTIETPTDDDNFLWFRAERAITVKGIDCLVGAATSAVITVQECDANGANCGTTESITCAATNTADNGIDDAAIDAGDWVRVDVGTVTGTVGQVSVTMNYTITGT